jgi:hypothetical protein
MLPRTDRASPQPSLAIDDPSLATLPARVRRADVAPPVFTSLALLAALALGITWLVRLFHAPPGSMPMLWFASAAACATVGVWLGSWADVAARAVWRRRPQRALESPVVRVLEPAPRVVVLAAPYDTRGRSAA